MNLRESTSRVLRARGYFRLATEFTVFCNIFLVSEYYARRRSMWVDAIKRMKIISHIGQRQSEGLSVVRSELECDHRMISLSAPCGRVGGGDEWRHVAAVFRAKILGFGGPRRSRELRSRILSGSRGVRRSRSVRDRAEKHQG